MRSRRLLLALLFVTLPATARAYVDASQFFDDPGNPHGATFGAVAEGLYFTGAPRFASQTCANCHVNAPGQVAIKIGAAPDTLFSDGYEPGHVYELEVELLGETAGLEHKSSTCTQPPGPHDTFTFQPCNNNNFALEIDDAGGTPLAGAGVFCAQAPMGGVCPMADATRDESVVAPDGDAVFGNRPVDANNARIFVRNGATSWHLWWTAPPAGSGPLTLFATAVDGNGGDGTVGNDEDPYGDDTVQASVFIPEAGAPVARSASAGCSLGGGAATTPWWTLAALLLAAFARRLDPPLVSCMRRCPRRGERAVSYMRRFARRCARSAHQ